MSSLVYLNGTYSPKLDAKLSVYDHGLLHGDGVWEGLRLREGDILRLDDHLKYLFAAAEAIALTIPHSPSQLARILRSAVAANSRRNGYIRVTVTRGPGTIGLDPRKCDPHVIVMVEDVVPFPSELYAHGLHVITAKSVTFDPANPLHRVRSLSHGHMALAKGEALRAGCLDAVLLTEDGRAAGTTEGRLFAVKAGSIATPYADGCVPGDPTADAIAATPADLSLADLHAAEELFLAGTSGGVIAIVRIDDHVIGEGHEGPITHTIRTASLSSLPSESVS